MLQRWDATGSTEMVLALLRSSTVALAEQLAAGLPDEFSRTVLAGSLGVAWDSANPIRANLFAAGIREAVTYVLHFLAPRRGHQSLWLVQDLSRETEEDRRKDQDRVLGSADARASDGLRHTGWDSGQGS